MRHLQCSTRIRKSGVSSKFYLFRIKMQTPAGEPGGRARERVGCGLGRDLLVLVEDADVQASHRLVDPLHGEGDQVVPVEDFAELGADLLAVSDERDRIGLAMEARQRVAVSGVRVDAVADAGQEVLVREQVPFALVVVLRLAEDGDLSDGVVDGPRERRQDRRDARSVVRRIGLVPLTAQGVKHPTPAVGTVADEPRLVAVTDDVLPIHLEHGGIDRQLGILRAHLARVGGLRAEAAMGVGDEDAIAAVRPATHDPVDLDEFARVASADHDAATGVGVALQGIPILSQFLVHDASLGGEKGYPRTRVSYIVFV